MNLETCQNIIDQAFADSSADLKKPEIKDAINYSLTQLDSGTWTIVERKDSEFKVNEWLKKAILLFFKMTPMAKIESGAFHYVDKVPLKLWQGTEGVRIVPGAIARFGCYLESGVIMMPSFVNIGARVGSGTMIDTWATVGSCAYIGKNVHLSGGVGIGGVLEPVQAKPVIVEDSVFVGSRAILVEGVHIEEGAVIGAGVTLTGSTKIIDVTTSNPQTVVGRVRKNAVVIPGTYPKDFAAGTYQVPCALIIGERKASTNSKTSLTEALRDFSVPT